MSSIERLNAVIVRAIPRELRNAEDQAVRLAAFIGAFEQSAIIGLKKHDQFNLARAQMLRKLKAKRRNSKLPQLIEVVLSRTLCAFIEAV